MMTYSSRTVEAGLGDERQWMGNTVRPVLVECVVRELRNGQLVETRTVKETGKMALVMS